jgi:hypothetical protein
MVRAVGVLPSECAAQWVCCVVGGCHSQHGVDIQALLHPAELLMDTFPVQLTQHELGAWHACCSSSPMVPA